MIDESLYFVELIFQYFVEIVLQHILFLEYQNRKNINRDVSLKNFLDNR